MWTSELARIARELELLSCSLADMGVLSRTMPPRVSPRDSRAVTRAKEQMIALHRRREAVLASLGEVGATILDRQTMEIAVPGGPEPDSYLSWQPGEPRFGWWRAAPSLTSPRRRLPLGHDEPGPVLH